MIIDLGPILYAVLILYVLAGFLFLVLVCAGIWIAKRHSKRLGSIMNRIRENHRYKRLSYRPVPQVQNR